MYLCCTFVTFSLCEQAQARPPCAYALYNACVCLYAYVLALSLGFWTSYAYAYAFAYAYLCASENQSVFKLSYPILQLSMLRNELKNYTAAVGFSRYFVVFTTMEEVS